jgi:hypothetical protein
MSEFESLHGMPLTYAQNLSRGFNIVLLAHLDKYIREDDTLLLVCEPPEVVPFFTDRWPQLEMIDRIGYTGDNGEDYEVDLCKPQLYTALYELVLCQALLEHVPIPSQVIENLANLTKSEGHLSFHTVTPGVSYHGYPIDCLRFLPDFFTSLENYLPIKLVDMDEYTHNIIVTYEKL